MPVSGREIASLDFANLIGGPLNAVVEAQAKSAITTVNFIKEVAFKDGKMINVSFKYNRLNTDGEEQQFTLNVPFLTMLPIPYITVNEAEIDFNAKITSINESKMEDNFEHLTEGEAHSWFMSANLKSKTSYQRKSGTSEKEERTFDMHVRVRAKNQDIPAGTERLLTILESSIAERKGRVPKIPGLKITDITGKTVKIAGPDKKYILKDATFTAIQVSNGTVNEKEYKIANIQEDGGFILDDDPGTTPQLINSKLESLKLSAAADQKTVNVKDRDISGFKNKACSVKIGVEWKKGKVKDAKTIELDEVATTAIAETENTQILISKDIEINNPDPIEINNPPPEPKPVSPKSGADSTRYLNPPPKRTNEVIPVNPQQEQSGTGNSITRIKKLILAEADKVQFDGTIVPKEIKELKGASFKVNTKTFTLGEFDSATQKWKIDPPLEVSEQNSMPGTEINLTLAEKKA
ncbi:MAG: DUF2589 domain-containing protein [Methanothrix sp.]